MVVQIAEYRKHGFDVKGIVGVNRSPSCGVETTSRENKEVQGQGVFVETVLRLLGEHGLHIRCVGMKASEPEKAVFTVKELLGVK